VKAYTKIILLAVVLTTTICNAQDFVIIVHPSNKISDINQKLLKKIYLNKKKLWEDGEIIQPLNLPPSNKIRKVFSEGVIKKTVKKVERIYLKKVLSGKSQPPKQVKKESEVVEEVSKNKGAVGYVSSKSVNDKVKVITIN